ncbi:uncharacterized protein LOC127864686 isoform X1 [Dreissena polymorpha]|uniref:uncharacterized protein LOC127864686 isoform X1 n=1 Tax=Dreissena polymorpha TaxID=45954 RepID=UPI0022653777|nr:uncharacterized protein LOC127864686 isoform X1 [Dreissena polymorpha]XP_052260546.1 uncharacterized protein LOC127864686 isoform X1 [Dreissena polymorpha]
MQSREKTQMQRAVSAVRQHKMKIRVAAREFNVPRSTLSDHVHGRVGETRPGPVSLLNDEEEGALVSYLLYMADHGFPMTRNRTRVYIREIIKQGGRTYPYKVSENGPSDEWFRKLFARHPELQERTPESLDPARSSMSREDVIYPFFDFLDKTLTQYGVKDKPSQIFNCDETGWSGKEKAKGKVITGKREHTINRKVMGGGGNHITAHLCVCADGRFLPTMIIFKGSLPHTRFTDGVPDTWLYGSSSTGYIDHELFQTWFMKGFLPHCGRARPVVLIMDNHDAHISLPVIQAARANDVVLIGFPGHTTHILQPLDVKIIGPLKTNMASLASDLGIVCPSLTIGKSKYPVLLKYAMDRITPSTIIGAFSKLVSSH